MRGVLVALALVLAGAVAAGVAWLVHERLSAQALDLDTVTKAAKAACAPMELEGGRTDGRTYFTFTCQREIDLGVCRPAPRGRVATSTVPP